MRRLAIAATLSIAAGAALYLAPSGGGAVVVAGKPYEVVSGPAWLAGLLYTSSHAARRVLLVAVGLGGAALAAAYARIGLTLEEREDVLQNATTVLLMGGSAWALSHMAPYWAAVAAGSIGGAAASRALSGQVAEAAADWHEAAEEE